MNSDVVMLELPVPLYAQLQKLATQEQTNPVEIITQLLATTFSSYDWLGKRSSTFDLPQDSCFVEESGILELLARQPSPAQVLAIRPSVKLQSRMSSLLWQSKQGELSPQDERELDRYLLLEHWVRQAKGYAYQQLANQT